MARRSAKKSSPSSVDAGADVNVDQDSQRIDKWLWHARFVRTRGAATQLVEKKRFRVNGRTGIKPSTQVRPGDVLTFNLSSHVRVIKVTAISNRRGGAPDAALLYDDLDDDQNDNAQS
ncbi:MAG: S4 domain-containing protein [Alphaproteobacteria bacterium]